MELAKGPLRHKSSTSLTLTGEIAPNLRCLWGERCPSWHKIRHAGAINSGDVWNALLRLHEQVRHQDKAWGVRLENSGNQRAAPFRTSVTNRDADIPVVTSQRGRLVEIERVAPISRA